MNLGKREAENKLDICRHRRVAATCHGEHKKVRLSLPLLAKTDLPCSAVSLR